MRKQLNKITATLLATAALTLAFLGCSSDGDDPPPQAQPSSSSQQKVLECLGLPEEPKNALTHIDHPAVLCNGEPVRIVELSVLTGGNELNWQSPKAGTYEVSMIAESGICEGEEAYCGTLEVVPNVLTCSGWPAATRYAGNKVALPEVLCNGEPVLDEEFSTTPTTLSFQSPAAGTYDVNVLAESGLCDGEEASCGSLTISSIPYIPPPPPAPSSSSVASSSSAVITYGSASQTCENGEKVYKTITIGTQTWMAENLNCETETGSKCYSNSDANCAKYGRLYDWATAMTFASTCNTNSCVSQIQAKHQGVCPNGWHLPSGDEWATLMTSVGGQSVAGKNLKATSDWKNKTDGTSGNGTDNYGFAALPGGGATGSSFYNIGDYSVWWGASENDANNAYSQRMDNGEDRTYGQSLLKTYLRSVRCVKD